ncbi:carboxypeptidase-like protein [Winogradskyella eximia]|uniref:Carboxypeptidase-like protein n=1 Tax=Winogradskyella eximia TaxID=262006 RepID=A0A3D9H8G9_9FLAO|nr:carboxypeptidase-like regulatory domain-containing protein [Winogradskyella eximia]RED45461.1 carboxypeptidase-like protein [Winogradskyella eximia]
MRLFTVLIILLCLPIVPYAQTLNGKVYDAKAPIKNINVFNKTQNRVTVTNEDGNFSIEAKVNDSISFQSIFYHNKTIVLKDFHLNGVAVFELKEILTELDEVEVKAEPEQPVFKEETYNVELQNILKEDIKNNPHLYKPAGATYGVDFVYLIGAVVKLFAKDKPKKPNYHPISYTQMDSLFNKSSFFNEQLITENLKIPSDKKYLFYDFCEAKQISSKLLKDENKMQLLEELVLNSQLFLILLEQYGEKPLSKE